MRRLLQTWSVLAVARIGSGYLSCQKIYITNIRGNLPYMKETALYTRQTSKKTETQTNEHKTL